MNSCFEPYRNRYTGQTALFFGTGPSLLEWDERRTGIEFGCNEVIHRRIVDFYFIGDPGDRERGYLSNPEAYQNYTPRIDKFFRGNSNAHMPQGVKSAHYYTVTDRANRHPFQYFADITKKMGYGITISLDVMQFIVFCGFAECVLIGHDCDYSNGTFNSPKARAQGGMIKRQWDRFEKWRVENKIPLRVLSFHPIGLKGTFEEL
jgi:hypothetical protein